MDEVEIQWYPVAPGAPALGMESVMAVPNWDLDGQQWEGTEGMVAGGPQLYQNYKPKVIANYAHVCGTAADFKDGAVFDPDIPPVKYGVQQLPQCCNPVVIPAGGAAVGGAAVVGFQPAPGADCTDAPLLDLDQDYTYTLKLGDDFWFKFNLTGSGTYHVWIDPPISLALFTRLVFFGSCPGGLVPQVLTGVTANCQEGSTGGAQPLWLRFFGAAAPVAITFHVGMGNC